MILDHCKVSDITVGNILDAQDYLGVWHLAIIIGEQGLERSVHFLPYSNHKRDETFGEDDTSKIAPAFNHSELPNDPAKAFETLRNYLTIL